MTRALTLDTDRNVYLLSLLAVDVFLEFFIMVDWVSYWYEM